MSILFCSFLPKYSFDGSYSCKIPIYSLHSQICPNCRGKFTRNANVPFFLTYWLPSYEELNVGNVPSCFRKFSIVWIDSSSEFFDLNSPLFIEFRQEQITVKLIRTDCRWRICWISFSVALQPLVEASKNADCIPRCKIRTLPKKQLLQDELLNLLPLYAPSPLRM